MKGLTCITALLFFITAMITQIAMAGVICGEPEDYEDENDNVWVTAEHEYTEDSWGGYREGTPKPETTFGQNVAVVDNKTGYDDFLFRNCTWSLDNTPLLYDLNVDKGAYDVNLLIYDHWSAGVRELDIKIEDNIVFEDYTTVAEPVVQKVSGVEVKDGVLSIEIIPVKGCGDPCGMLSALEVVGPAAVELSGKLSTTWGKIKALH